jgi:ABC-type transport system involved in cytochrome c biogenesis permease subunit
MATATALPSSDDTLWSDTRTGRAGGSAGWQLLKALGSLKITVTMFLAAVFLLFVGTLAQDEKNLPEVKAEYFNSWLARVPLSDFFPVTIFGESSLTGWFPFPGGATIGLVLLINLIAAKVTRFHVTARGQRLVWGTLVSLLGGLITVAVILGGHQADGLQGRPPFDYDVVWGLVQAGGALLAAGLTVAAATARTGLTRGVAGLTAVVVAVVTLMTIVGGEAWRMNEPGLRIMWQLIQSSVASLVLLAGLVMVFGARGGNVLIHLAVGLLMVGQFVFGDRQIEERMTILEGRETNVACRTDEVELAVIDTSGGDTEGVTAIAGRLLRARSGGEPIEVDDLPFTLRVVDYFPNSSVARADSDAANPATTGLGEQWIASERPPEGGASSRTNIASAYVALADRESGRSLGTYLVSQFLNDQSQVFAGADRNECDIVDADGRPWRLQLRFRREYKPYSVRLDDVRRINYSASETPRDYSSYVTFTDQATGAEQKGRIWMNNPVRYRGETFYQSTYSEVDLGGGTTAEMTGLQVVENAGWLVPYVACVLAFWGMLVHFGGTFLRYADRYERQRRVAADDGQDRRAVRKLRGRVIHTASPRFYKPFDPADLLSPLAAVLCVAGIAGMAAWPRGGEEAAAWRAAGSLPVMHEGRIKPLDTVARNTVQLLSNRTSVRMPAEEEATAGDPGGSVTATQWLLALMAGSEWPARAPVFRIDAKEVVDLFDLPRRPGHRYAYAELEPKRADVRRQIETLRDMPREERSFGQQKLLELEQKLSAYELIRVAYQAPPMPTLTGDDEVARRAFLGEVMRMMQGARLIESNHPPALIPPLGRAAGDPAEADRSARWQALEPALVDAIVAKILAGRPGQPPPTPNPAIFPLTELLEAVEQDATTLGTAVAAYRAAAGNLPEFAAAESTAASEAWFNAFNPTFLARWLYVVAVLLCFSSFLVWKEAWREASGSFAWWLLAGIFLLHTFALGMRIWLTGRPPVVNLYSSAVFIGWACVLAGLVLERLHRIGVGNLIAAIAGGLTLGVAYGLESGDTMHVLQAVLDTQFWLSTHVITVTLGYGATFLAGLLGTMAIVHRGWAELAGQADTPASRDLQDRLYRMNYGVVCFALFFSFIGTVLGGLWADDSWGRFWGWDPKENGALMIVLWNAAVLHARWDRWIGPRGFALFTIGGNIVTAWSWFGTNQLGIGLHSYGFTSGVLLLLGGYVASQLLLLAAGWALTSRSQPAGG